VLIAVVAEMVTDVGAPLLVNVAVLSGTVGFEVQFVPVVHSLPGPVQVPSVARAAVAASIASAPTPALAMASNPTFACERRRQRLRRRRTSRVARRH
jgi:hypothetical protein